MPKIRWAVARVEAVMMALSTKFGVRNVKCGILRILTGAAVFACILPVYAANESLLSAPDWPAYKWFASTDPKHQNEDYLLLKPGETRKIRLVSGRLERLWWTAIEPEKIRISINGDLHPNGPYGSQTHEKATVFMSDRDFLTNSVAEWAKEIQKHIGVGPTPVSLPSSSQLVVTNLSKNPEGNKFFYQVAIRPNRLTSAAPPLPKPLSETVQNSLAPGGEKTTDYSGAGVIDSIRLTLNKPEDLKNLHLRATWDGDTTNAIDAPLSALLDLFEGGNKVQSAGFVVDGKTAVLKWPMPFGSGMKVTFKNEGSSPVAFTSEISVAKLTKAPAYRFHAVYGSTRTQLKKPVQMLDVTGKGAFCGLNLSIAPAPDSHRRTFAYLEGNETITADNQKFEGTGTEDFFNSAWYFPKQAFSFPYHGLTFKSEAPPSVAAYRLMIPDAVPFKKSLRFEFEQGKGNNSDDLIYRWVAFWYADPSAKFAVQNTAVQGSTVSLVAENGAPAGTVSQLPVILTALISALFVGVGGALLFKRSQK